MLILSTVILYFMVSHSFRQCRIKDRQGYFSNKNRLKLQLEIEDKLTKTVFWVSALLIIGVLPYVMLLQLNKIIILFNTLDVLKCNKTFVDLQYYWVMFEMLVFSLNPLIYISRYQVNRGKLNRLKQRLLAFFQTKRVFPKPRN